MTPTARPVTHNPDWEKANQPRIGKGRLVLSLIVYAAWLGFLGYFAAMRWFGAML